MKSRSICTFIMLAMWVSVSAQQKPKKYALESEKLKSQAVELDRQILQLNQKIKDVIAKYQLLTLKGIKMAPYQTTFKQGKGFIEMERHRFLHDDLLRGNIIGIKTKKIKIYTSGNNVSRIESRIFEKYFNSEETFVVEIDDPSPTVSGTNDVKFTHIVKGRPFLKKKPLGKIKNTTAFPTRNEIKQEFLIPHLDYFLDSLRTVGDTYYKGQKDADNYMADFLKKSVKY